MGRGKWLFGDIWDSTHDLKSFKSQLEEEEIGRRTMLKRTTSSRGVSFQAVGQHG